MSITKITIKNFRSIVSLSEEVNDLNIFVGPNDIGKSNILRALDLFFNGEKRHGYELDWSRDYCAFAPRRIRKAEEIVISLEVAPPRTFKSSKPVTWKKVWRKEGLHLDTIKHKDGSKVSSKSKMLSFARTMRYDYVPAIKGEEYFKALMANLHDMLEATVEEQVRTASGTFTKTINDNTQPILKEILEQLELETTIELPSSLRDLFAQLEFRSRSERKYFSLGQRGDGIKVRHIPIVLRWLADQANHLSAPGRPKTVTIWGYEEPENNLELSRCFDMAKEFVNGASTIQTFITTHSPAFYSVCRENESEVVKLFSVNKEDSPPTTSIQPFKGDLAPLDSSMGLLKLIEPHFKEAREKYEKLRSDMQRLDDTSKPTIFCEGESDQILLEQTMELFYAEKKDSVKIKFSQENGGGHSWVSDKMMAWSYNRPTAKAVGLFDKDDAAKKSKQEANNEIKNSSQSMVFGVDLIPGDELRACYDKNISVPFAIEELLPRDVWCHAESEGWLEDRPNPHSLYNRCPNNSCPPDVALTDHLKEVLEDDHLCRIALKKVKLKHKKSLCQYVRKLSNDEKKRVLKGVKPTLKKCLIKLNILNNEV